MRIAVGGAGKVGLYIANDLAKAGHDVLLLEKNEAALGRLQLHTSVNAALADCCEIRSMERLELNTYDVLVAATGDDEDNLVMSLLAKQEFAVPRVIARVNHPANERLFNEAWGVDISVSTPHLLTALVEEATTVGQLVRLLQLRGGKVDLVECTLTPDSPVVGKEISQLEVPRGANIVAVIRDGSVVVPRGDTRLHDGDEVVALVADDAVDALRTLFGIVQTASKR